MGEGELLHRSQMLFKCGIRRKGGLAIEFLDVLREGIPPRIEVSTQDEEKYHPEALPDYWPFYKRKSLKRST